LRVTTGQVHTRTYTASGYNKTFTYTYDDNGNILSVSDGTYTTSYVYDNANQLIRENNQAGGFTHVWTYDDAGNILWRDEYSYSTGTLDYPDATFDYYYSTSGWGDLLTEYDCTEYHYDNMGNRSWDDNWEYEWQKGRQLYSLFGGDEYWHFSYNSDGMRIGRYNSEDDTEYTYYYNGSLLRVMTVDGNKLYFVYDASGTPIEVSYTPAGSTTVGFYYFVTNLQGDVIAILNSSGAVVVEYTYDAWGNILSITGSMASTLGRQNPLRYRGYVYDQEIGFYYLQSRYYDPEIGRFINADAFTSTGQGLLGNNMFAYCRNNPVKRKDASGTDDICAINADEDNDPLNDYGPISSGGGYANAYNSIDAGYHYGVDFSMASNSSLTTGGIYRNGYSTYGVYSNPAGSGYSSSPTTSVCFVAGTLVQCEDDSKTIEDISVGDKVWAWDEETGDIALKEVVETYVTKTDKLIHVFVNGEEIITTPTHPFYSPVKGWTKAAHLRAGDILVLVNGEHVIVEKVQHEILETPVTVYNFHVEDYHTYYVADIGVLVHNSCNHNSAWDAERRNYWTSEGHKYAAENANGQASQSGTYLVTTDNINLMLMGYAPFGIDGKKVQLHHAKGIANDFYDYYEITATNHRSNFKMLHGYLYK